MYQGRFPATGEVRQVAVAFGSRRGGASVPMRVTVDGRFCIVWAHERDASATAAPASEAIGADGARSADLGAWLPSRTVPIPAGCQRVSATVPWDHSDDLRQTWEFALLIVLSVIGFVGALGVLRVAPSHQEMALVVPFVALFAAGVLNVTLWG
jgi:hypothetical protein